MIVGVEQYGERHMNDEDDRLKQAEDHWFH